LQFSGRQLQISQTKYAGAQDVNFAETFTNKVGFPGSTVLFLQKIIPL